MKLLIIYGTTEGQTRKICTYLREKAEASSHTVELHDASMNPLPPDNFDRVIVAASVHAQGYQGSVRYYIQDNYEALNRIQSAFLSVSLTAAADDEESWEELKELTEDFLEDCNWEPTYTEYVAGALLYTKYNFFKRFIMRLIAKNAGGETDTSQDYEYTDWNQVELLLDGLMKP